MKLSTNRGYDIYCKDGSCPGHKAIILCLHGFAGSKRSPRILRLHEEMAEWGIGTFSFDWPAHGESNAGFKDLTVENCLKDLDLVYHYLKDHYGLPVWCFATSFGGYLAALYHQRHPEAFGKLMLRSPALKMGQVMKAMMNEDQFATFLEGARLDFGLDQPLLLTEAFYRDVCAHDAFGPDLAHPERIMIIHGSKDELVPPEHSLQFAGKCGIAIRLREGAGHSYDHPGDVDWVMDMAREFFLAGEE